LRLYRYTAVLMTILVFKTSVKYKKDIKLLAPVLNTLPANVTWHFDLEDPDRILRVETKEDVAAHVTEALQLNGFACEELVD